MNPCRPRVRPDQWSMARVFPGLTLSRGVGSVLLFMQLAAAPPKQKWTLGSPSSLVEQVQGKPLFVERLVSLGYQVWRFGDSWVRLSYSDDRVIAWSNTGALKVELRPGADTTRDRRFGAGSTRDDVVRLQGTPTALEPRPDAGLVLLLYGTSVVRISATDGRVVSWQSPSGVLMARVTPPPVTMTLALRPADGPMQLTTHVEFQGVGDDSVLDADARATIAVTVHNDGQAPVRDIRASATLERSFAGVDIGKGERAEFIPPGATVTLRVAVATAESLPDGVLALRVSIDDGRSAVLRPARLLVRTRAFRAPALALEAIGIRDQSGNGRIEPREIIDVTARIVNRGAGNARDVRLTIDAGDQVQLTPESQRRVSLGTLRPGEMRDVQFSAFANAAATAFPVILSLHESRPRFDTLLVLPLALDLPYSALATMPMRGSALRAHDVLPPMVIDVDNDIPRALARPNAVAVVFGVERYERAPGVPFARRDAAVFREYVSRLFGIGDDPARLYFRTDDEVTIGEVRKVFGDDGWLARRVTSETDVVVYWAGHGEADLKSHAGYLLPNDADPNYPAQTGIALVELYDRLAALHAHSVTVFIDACFSGNTRSGAPLLDGARGVVVSLEHPALRSATMAVFSAATGEQLASAWPQQQHGVFTYWLLKGLRGEADVNGDGLITVDELDRFVRMNVSRTAALLDREQTPQVVAREKSRTLVWLP